MVRSPSVASRPPCPTLQSHPTDLELVNTYLRPWVQSGLKSGAFIHEADVYSADPADLTREFPPAVAQDGERAWYFYTPLRQKSVHGKRKARTVATGAGCWHNEAKSKDVYLFHNGKRQVGYRQSFSFILKDDGKRVRSGWLMMEFSLLRDGQEAGEAGALGRLVLCKVYRSPRNPEREPCGSEAVASPGHKAEADDDDESSDATAEHYDDDSSDATLDEASPRKSYGEESREATLVADDEISGAAAAALGRKEKAQVRDDYDETSAAAPTLKRKALDDESRGAAVPASALKKKADVSSSSPDTPISTTEMQCPQCGAHLVVTLKRAKTKSETEIAKDDSPALGAPQPDETRASSQKSVPFLEFV